MAYALVGTIGTAVQTASGIALTTATFGTSENRTAGNLLVFFVSVTGSATLPTTPGGWSIASQKAGTSCSATVYYKIAAGSDAAPTISAITSGLIAGQLAEFSGFFAPPIDQSGNNAATTSPVTATFGGADSKSGELMLVSSGDFRSVARSPTDTITSNHATITQAGNNNTVSSVNHYSFGYSLASSSNSGADTAIMTPTVTTSITGLVVAAATFKLVNNFTSSLTGTLSFVGSIGKNTSKILTGALSFIGKIANLTKKVVTAALSFIGDISYLYILDSYPNASTFLNLFSGVGVGIGQSFTPGHNSKIIQAIFNIDRVGSPTGNVTANLYAHSGVYGTSSVPGALLATSDTVDVSTIPTSASNLQAFNFSGVNQYSLTSGTHYFISLEYSGGDSTDKIQVWIDATSPSHPGNIALKASTTWAANATEDMIFYVLGSTTAGGTLYTYSDTGTLSFVGGFGGTKTLKGLTGALSFIGSIQKFIFRVIMASLSFSGSVAKNITLRPLTAALSFSGSVTASHFIAKVFTATLNFVGTYRVKTIKGLAAVLSFSGVLAKSTRHVFTATISFIGTIGKKVILDSLTGTLYFFPSPVLYVQFQVKFTTAQLTTGDFSVGDIFDLATNSDYNAALSFPQNLIIVDYLLTGSSWAFFDDSGASTFYPSAVSAGIWYTIDMKIVRNSGTATVTPRVDGVELAPYTTDPFYSNIFKAIYYGDFTSSQTLHSFSLSRLTIGSTTWGSSDIFVADPTVGTVTPPFDFIVGSGITATGGEFVINTSGNTNAFGVKSLDSVLSMTTLKGLTGSLSFIGLLSKYISRSLTASLSFAGSMAIKTLKTIAGALSFVGTITQAHIIPKVLTATLSFSGSITRKTLKGLTGSLSFVGTFGPTNTFKGLTAALSSIGAIAKTTYRLLTPIVNTGTTANAIFYESGSDATQGTSFWSATAGTVTSDSAGAITGPRSIKCATSSNVSRNGCMADSGRRLSFRFKTDALATAGQASSFLVVRNSSNSIIFTQGLNSSGVLTLGATGTGANTTGTTILNINTAYRIAFSYVITNSTTYSVNVYIDGILELTRSNIGTLTTTVSDRFALSTGAFAGMNSWFDDIYLDDGSDLSDPGNIIITNKRTVANGALNQFTTQIGSGGSGYGTGHSPQVNEQPLSTTNGWSIASASLLTEEYTIEGPAVGDINVSDASSYALIDYMGWIHCNSATAGTRNIIVNGAATNISTGTGAGGLTFFKAGGSRIYPSGNNAIGMDNNSVNNLTRLFEAGILFAYLVSPPATSLGFGGTIYKSTSKVTSGALSFVGIISLLTNKIFSAGLSFIGSLANSTSRAFTASLSFIGTIANKTLKGLAGTLSFIGNLATQYIAGGIAYLKSFTASLSFSGDISKKTSKSLPGVLSFTGIIARQVLKVLPGSLSFVGSILRSTLKGLSGSLGFSGTLARNILKSLAGSLSFIGTIAKETFRTFTGACSFIGTHAKRTGKALSGILSFIGNLTFGELIELFFTATLSFSGSLAKQTRTALSAILSFSADFIAQLIGGAVHYSKALAATLDFSGVLSKETFRPLSATLSFVGTIAKTVYKIFSGSLSFIGNLSFGEIFQQAFTAALNFSGALSKKTLKSLTGSLSFIGTLANAIYRPLSASLSFTGSLAKKTYKTFTATLSFIGNLTAQLVSGAITYFKSFSGSLSFSSIFSKTTQKRLTAILSFISVLSALRMIAMAFTAALNFSGQLANRTSKPLRSTLSFSGSIAKAVFRVFSASLSFAADFLANLVAQVYTIAFTATLGFTGTLNRMIFKSMVSSLQLTGTLAKLISTFFFGTISFIVKWFKLFSADRCISAEVESLPGIQVTVLTAPVTVLATIVDPPAPFTTSTLESTGFSVLIIEKC